MKRIDNILLFSNDDIFSNNYQCNIRAFGQDFTSSWQFYLYLRAMAFGDADKANATLHLPNEAKELDEIKGSEAMWSFVKTGVMFLVNYFKFSQNVSLRNQLLETEDVYLADATTDTTWGIGLTEDDVLAGDCSSWTGTNLLGHVLMRVRTAIGNEEVE